MARSFAQVKWFTSWMPVTLVKCVVAELMPRPSTKLFIIRTYSVVEPATSTATAWAASLPLAIIMP